MIRPLLLGSALALAATAAAAQQQSRAHMEGCLVWSAGGAITARNECSRPLTILFMAFGDQRVIEAEVAAGGSFDAAARWGESGGFMFTACPTSYAPSVRFSLENKTAIVESLYNCLGRPQARLDARRLRDQNAVRRLDPPSVIPTGAKRSGGICHPKRPLDFAALRSGFTTSPS